MKSRKEGQILGNCGLGKDERATENKMERCAPTRLERYWAESGREDGESDARRRPYMTKCAKRLGVTISSDLTWNKHFENIVAKTGKRMHMLYQLKRQE